MDNFFAALGRFVVRFRYAVIIGWIAFGAFCVVAFPSLGSVANTKQSDFLPSNSPSLQAQKLELRYHQQNENLAALTLVAVTRDTRLPDTAQVSITHLENRIRRFPHVTSVADFGTARDGRARQAEILAAVPAAGGGTADTLIERIRASFSHAPPGISYHLAGDLAANYDSVQQTNKSGNTAQLLSFLIIIVLLLLAFRSLLAPIVALVTAGAALLISGPIIGESTHLHVPVSSVTEVVLIVLLLGAGTDYCVFLLSRMREEIRNGLTPRDAVTRSVATVGESISFSAFTVIAALMSLLFAQFGIYQSLGPPLAIGIAVMLVAGLTLFPALLASFGQVVFWPARPTTTRERRDGIWARTAGRVISYPWATLIIGILVFAALALGQIGAPTTGGFTSALPSGSDSAEGQQILDAHFPTSSANPEVAIFAFGSSLWTNPTPAAVVQHQLASNPVFRRVTGPFGAGGFTPTRVARLYTVLGPPQNLPPARRPGRGVDTATYNAYRGLAQFLTPDGKTIQFFTTPRHTNVNSMNALNDVPALRAAITKSARATRAQSSGVFGLLPIAYDISQVSNHDLRIMIPIVAVLIAILLAIVLRSLIAPLFLVVSVVLSYLAALGLAGIVFVHLGAQLNLSFVLPLIMFIFLMALGSDYNILVMSRIREESRSLPIAQAVKRAIGATGASVTTAGLILGGTFAALALSASAGQAGEETRQIGYGIAAGILLDTFLVRTLLVPSAVVLLGRRTWWPSRLWGGKPRRETTVPDLELDPVKA